MSKLLRSLSVLLVLFTSARPLLAQSEADKMIEKYLAAETDRLSKRVLDGATTLEEWQQRRPRLQQEYLYMLGLAPLPAKTPLKATVTGTLERDSFVVEKLHFQSKPGLYVTGSLYRPRKVEGKLPAVLYVCGHSNRGRDGNRSAFQDHGMWFASNGYVCLAIDTLQLGEIAGIHHGTYNLNRWWWHSRGYTPAGVECWNGVRAIDYLVSRPDVDAERIGVTGISGGGAATFWIAAADQRVKVAVPVSGMSDLESYVKNKVINGHCDCMFLHNAYGWEWTTIAALVAPRPLLFANSDNDKIFPMDGNRRIIERLRKLYKMHGKADLVDEYVSVGGHDYRPDLRVAIFKFFNKHLKNDTKTPVKDSADFKPFAGPEQRVFPEDKDIPADALNAKIDEIFVPAAELKLPAPEKFEHWKEDLVEGLKELSFRSIRKRIAPAQFQSLASEGESLTVLYSEPNISVRTFERVILSEKNPKTCTLFVSDLEKEDVNVPLWAEPFTKVPPVVRLTPRGVGPFAWSRKSPPNYVARAHVLLGRTVEEGQVRDIASVARRIREKEKLDVCVVGRERGGVLAAYAGLFEPSIKEVIIVNPPKTHKDGPYFLNVMRVLDIPEAFGLLAPHIRLTLINAQDAAFDRTEAIYRLAGAQANFRRIVDKK